MWMGDGAVQDLIMTYIHTSAHSLHAYTPSSSAMAPKRFRLKNKAIPWPNGGPPPTLPPTPPEAQLLFCRNCRGFRVPRTCAYCARPIFCHRPGACRTLPSLCLVCERFGPPWPVIVDSATIQVQVPRRAG